MMEIELASVLFENECLVHAVDREEALVFKAIIAYYSDKYIPFFHITIRIPPNLI